MDVEALLKKVRTIDLSAKQITADIGAGNWKSVMKGQGMTFSDVRPYTFGDNWRHFDWNVTARTGEPHVKVYRQDKEMQVFLLLDVSPSTWYGTSGPTKTEAIAELSAIIAWSAVRQMDRFGYLLFDEKPLQGELPSRKKQHIWMMLHRLLNQSSGASQTDIAGAIAHLSHWLQKRSLVFIISDFATPDFSKELKGLATRHEVVGLWCQDHWNREVPDLGLVRVLNPETHMLHWVDTSSTVSKNNLLSSINQHRIHLEQSFKNAGATLLPIPTWEPLHGPLLRFFNKKNKQQ